MFRMCDHVEGRRVRDESLPRRVGRLSDDDVIPRVIAAMMRSLVTCRNAVEYEDIHLTDAQRRAVHALWHAVSEWATDTGFRVDE